MKFHIIAKLGNKYTYDNVNGGIVGSFVKRPYLLPIQKHVSLEFVLGFACNQKCTYCDQVNYQRTESIVNYSTSYIQQLAINAVKYVSERYPSIPIEVIYWGGEGLLYLEQIKTLHKTLVALGINKHRIMTNGRLLVKPEIANWVLEHNISINLSYDGKHTKQYRGYDPLQDSLITPVLRLLNNKNKLVVCPTLYKGISRKEVITVAEELLEHSCLFGDMKFIFPETDSVYETLCIKDSDLLAWSSNEYNTFLSTPEICQKSTFLNIEESILESFSKPTIPYYPKEASRNCVSVAVAYNGDLLYRHNQTPSGKYVYGNVFSRQKAVPTPPESITDFINKKCLTCLCYAVGDRGCFFNPDSDYCNYYCKTNVARIAPIFAYVLTKLTEQQIQKIVDEQGHTIFVNR